MRGLWELARFRDIREVEEVGAWLEDKLPGQSSAGIVHGDYKLDNVIFAPRSPARLIAVVDSPAAPPGLGPLPNAVAPLAVQC